METRPAKRLRIEDILNPSDYPDTPLVFQSDSKDERGSQNLSQTCTQQRSTNIGCTSLPRAIFPLSFSSDTLSSASSYTAESCHNYKKVGSGELFCFGALPSLTLNTLSALCSFVPTSDDLVLYKKQSSLWLYRKATDEAIGRLSDRDTTLVGSIRSCNGIELQCDLISVPDLPQQSARKDIPGCGSTTRIEEQVYTLSVTIYGLFEWADSVGDYLSTYREYLQIPVRARRNVRYYNPQSLSIKPENSPFTFALCRHEPTQQDRDDLARIDPSDQLESTKHLVESSTPSYLKTELYRHQKQALSFMSKRESGWNLSSNGKDIWRCEEGLMDDIRREDSHPYSQVRNGQQMFYRNIVTGQVSVCAPVQFRGGIFADSMGLGKSLSMIALIATTATVNRYKLAHTTRSTTLIVVPLSLLSSWQEQLQRHLLPGKILWLLYHSSQGSTASFQEFINYDVVVTTYDTVSIQWRNASKSAQPLFCKRWYRVVLDEAHEIRSSHTMRAQAACNLKSDIRWAVTGTPIQNSIDDLASLLLYLRVFDESSPNSLKSYCRSIAAEDHVKEALLSICLRRSKATLSLQPRQDVVKIVSFDDRELSYYKSVNDSVKSLLTTAEASPSSRSCSDVLVKINSLRQICNLGTGYLRKKAPLGGSSKESVSDAEHLFNESLSSGTAMCVECAKSISAAYPIELEDLPHDSSFYIAACGSIVCWSCSTSMGQLRMFGCQCSSTAPCTYLPVCLQPESRPDASNADDTTSSKVNAIVNAIHNIPEEDKVLVFSFWTSSLDMVGRALGHNASSARIDGSMNSNQRQAAIDTFNTDVIVRVLLISLRCGCHGLNLTVANHVLLMEPQWNPMLEEQALSRVHRIGQEKQVYTTRFVVKGTFEENVRSLQAKKRGLVDQVFNSRKSIRQRLERMKDLTQESGVAD